MPKKKVNKALENSQKVWEDMKAKKKEKRKVPDEGKCQIELTDIYWGKDHFENKAYIFEYKVVGGVNEGLTSKKEVALECKDDSKLQAAGFSGDEAISWALAELEKIGVENPFEQAEVTEMVGSIVNATFKKSKNAKANHWPKLYFNALEAGPPMDDEVEEVEQVDEVAVEDDDEYNYVAVE